MVAGEIHRRKTVTRRERATVVNMLKRTAMHFSINRQYVAGGGNNRGRIVNRIAGTLRETEHNGHALNACDLPHPQNIRTRERFSYCLQAAAGIITLRAEPIPMKDALGRYGKMRALGGSRFQCRKRSLKVALTIPRLCLDLAKRQTQRRSVFNNKPWKLGIHQLSIAFQLPDLEIKVFAALNAVDLSVANPDNTIRNV